MINGENLFSNLLTVGILLMLALIVYLKMTHKTLVDFIKGIRDATSNKTEDMYDYLPTPNTFQDIR